MKDTNFTNKKMVHIVLFYCCWLLYVDPIIEFGGSVALEREAGVARAMLLTRGATRERHTAWPLSVFFTRDATRE